MLLAHGAFPQAARALLASSAGAVAITVLVALSEPRTVVVAVGDTGAVVAVIAKVACAVVAVAHRVVPVAVAAIVEPALVPVGISPGCCGFPFRNPAVLQAPLAKGARAWGYSALTLWAGRAQLNHHPVALLLLLLIG